MIKLPSDSRLLAGTALRRRRALAALLATVAARDALADSRTASFPARMAWLAGSAGALPTPAYLDAPQAAAAVF